MKRIRSIVCLFIVFFMILGVSYYLNKEYTLYKREISNMQIVHRYSADGYVNDSYYRQERFHITFPESEFHGEQTIDAILWNIRKLCGSMPDKLEILFFDSLEDYKSDNSYYSYKK